MTNPFINNKKIFAAYSVLWFAIFLIHVSVLTFFLKFTVWTALLDSAFFNILYQLLGVSLWYTVSFNSLENYSAVKIFLNHIAAAVITSGLWISAGYYIMSHAITGNALYSEFLLKSLIWRFLIGILFYIIII